MPRVPVPPVTSMLYNYGFVLVAFVFDVAKLTQNLSSTTPSLFLDSATKAKMTVSPLGLAKSQNVDLAEHPGDPSLILTTNVDLGERKLDVMKACSKAIADHTGKPESYVGKFTSGAFRLSSAPMSPYLARILPLIAARTRSLLAVSITDNASLIFGGSDAPAALGCLYSIGGISQLSNGLVTSAVSDALAPFHVSADRIYINFFDVPRANVGWNRRTFAG